MIHATVVEALTIVEKEPRLAAPAAALREACIALLVDDAPESFRSVASARMKWREGENAAVSAAEAVLTAVQYYFDEYSSTDPRVADLLKALRDLQNALVE